MNKIEYDCVKDITKALKKRFKGIQANSYGFCCNSDYDAIHKYINDNDYVCAKIFRGGLNNQFYVEWFNVDFDNFNNTIDEVYNYIIKDCTR